MSNKEIEESISVDFLPNEIENNKTYSINQPKPNYYTHGFFKYPCKFIPEIPKWAIKKYSNKGDLIFDPFTGSGTTLLEANLNGRYGVGTEIDPIAIKITEVKTQKYTEEILENINNNFNSIIYKIENNESVDVYIPKINNLSHWFTAENATILGKIRTLINEIDNNETQSFLEIVFLSIIKPVSQADNTSPKPYVSSKYIKVAPNALEKFKSTFKRYLKMITDFERRSYDHSTKFVPGDALNTKAVFKADIAITSPPYINAFDYPRTLRLENLWMSTHTEKSLLESKSDYVGTERIKLNNEREKELDILDYSTELKGIFYDIKSVDEKRAYIVKKFFEDMRLNLLNVKNHLKKDGYYIIVIGDSVIRKNFIESWKILKDIAISLNFKYVENFSYDIKNPYVRIPRSGKGGKIKKDHVLVLKNIESE